MENLFNNNNKIQLLWNIKNVYFYHMRKAGGSSIRKLLDNYTDKHNLKKIEVQEGYALQYNYLNKDKYISAINIRCPIERTVSLYHDQCKKHKGCNLLITDYLNSTLKKSKQNFFWGEKSNYYIKCLIYDKNVSKDKNINYQGINYQVTHDDYLQAINIIDQFDIIFVLENNIYKVINKINLELDKIPHINKTKEKVLIMIMNQK